MKYYAFIHFSPNTFTNKEWGYGDESPADFNPTELDCRQWARVAKEAGMEGIIITAKHHDGFCLWPSAFTEHSIKNSPWKDGKGDILRELRNACDEYGLKLGVYLSPWDRNHEAYGTPEYIDYYRNQLRELLTNYGEIFEVWFDGANGGDGYYGGSNEIRKIDNKTYYDWPNTRKIVRELQPMAAMFSDGGPDIRWVGNERGYANETNWSTINGGNLYPGVGGVNKQLQNGDEDGDTWLPAEVDVSIRPGWFYHEEQDSLVKSVDQLVDIWLHSVGMNSNLLLNLPPDRRGLIHQNDVARLMEFKAYRDRAFSVDLTDGASINASNVRGKSSKFSPDLVLDDSAETYWSTKDEITSASLEIHFGKTVEMNTILIQENIALGQRVKSFSVEALMGKEYVEITSGTTIGNRRIVQFEKTASSIVRINIEAKACPVISNLEVYLTPN